VSGERDSVPSTTGFVVSVLAIAVVWFVLLWVAIGFTIASVSGWRRLRRLYGTGPFAGTTFRFAGFVGRSRYRGTALIAGATPAGLYLNVAAPFRIGAGPVLVPWRDIAVTTTRLGLDSLVTVEFPRARTSLRLPEKFAEQLLERRTPS
jgi:hypothetical protein